LLFFFDFIEKIVRFFKIDCFQYFQSWHFDFSIVFFHLFENIDSIQYAMLRVWALELASSSRLKTDK